MRKRGTTRLAVAAACLVLVAPIPAVATTPSPPSASTTASNGGNPGSSPPSEPVSRSASPAATSVALPIVVVMQSLTPIAPQPGDVLRLTGTLHNISTAPVADLGVQLRYNPTRIGSRSEFDDYAIGSRTGVNGAFGPLPLPPVVFSTAAVSLPQHTLAAGASETFAVSVKLDGLRLAPWQVYELGVQVNGSTTVGFIPVGGLRTFLPWAPVGVPGVGVPTQVAWVWPLVDQPHRSVANTWLDDGLAKAIAAGGRLADLLAAGKAAQDQQQPPTRRRNKKAPKPKPVPQVTPVPVTWAIDPLLVEDVAAMANGYKVGSGRAVKTGTGADEARAWLNALKDATGKSETLALPYADPDIVAATRAGLGSQVQVAINSGTTSLSRLLSTAVLSYDWPPSGLVDQRTLDTLFAAGVTTVLLDGGALPPVDPPSVTPGARTTVRARDGNLDALLTDSGLTTVVGIGAQEPEKGPLAIQRFLAETLMVQAERPSLQRTLVVAPDRRWSPQPSYAAALLSDSGKVPWIAPVPLSRALAAPTDSDVPRLPLNYPAVLRRTELTRGYLAGVRALKARADTFAAILPTPGDPHARAFDDALLRTTSSAWRDHRDGATTFLDDVGTQLRATMRRVRIASLPGSFVTLTSHSGTVPITVANDLDTPVSVIVAISSQHLKVSGGGRKAQTIEAHRQISVDVRAEARTSGVFQLDVELLTPRGDVYDAEQMFVRSTAYGSVAILITAGATGVLLFAVAVRLTRRALAARRSTRATPA